MRNKARAPVRSGRKKSCIRAAGRGHDERTIRNPRVSRAAAFARPSASSLDPRPDDEHPGLTAHAAG